MPVREGRHAWVQVTAGTLDANGEMLQAGDGLAVSDERNLVFSSVDGGELLLFDLA